MSYGSLVLRNLLRSRRRLILTVVSVGIAIFLFVALKTVLTTFDDAVSASDDTRLITRRSTSLTFYLPLTYAERIRRLNGVEGVTWANWFGGTYIDNSHYFARFGADLATYLPIYPEMVIPAAQMKDLMADKSGCVIGRVTAEKYGLKIGDRMTLKGDIYAGEYTFTVRAIYQSSKPNFDETLMFFHWQMLDESSGGRGNVGIFVTKIAPGVSAARLCRTIDSLFANSPAESKTETETAFNVAFMSMIGNVTALLSTISVAIILSIAMVAANTMAMAIRERTTEIGLLKVLGFPVRRIFQIVMSEAIVLSLVGGVVGTIIARLTLHGFNAGGALPFFLIRGSTIVEGLAISMAIGLAAGVYPAIKASRISPQEALGTIG